MATLPDISAQIAKLEAEIACLKTQSEAQRKEEIADVVEDLRARIAEYGITAADLGFGRSKAKPARRGTLGEAIGKRQKCRGPNGETWLGGTRGRKPRWLKDALASGKTLAELAV